MADRRGFTLVEVLVAVALLAVVVLMARGLVAGALDGTRRLADHRRRLDAEMNAQRWLVSVFAVAHPAADSVNGKGFVGDSTGLSFVTDLMSPGGWSTRERIDLGAWDGMLIARSSSGAVGLMGSVERLEIDYLIEPGSGSPWVRGWRSRSGLPFAVRLRIGRSEPEMGVDTVLLRLGRDG